MATNDERNQLLHATALRRGERAMKLKATGKTWKEVGRIMRVSRQRAWQLAEAYRKEAR